MQAEPAAEALERTVRSVIMEFASAPLVAGAPCLELTLREDLGLESVTLVSLIFRLEEEFESDIDDTEVDLTRLSTVGDLIEVGRALAHAA